MLTLRDVRYRCQVEAQTYGGKRLSTRTPRFSGSSITDTCGSLRSQLQFAAAARGVRCALRVPIIVLTVTGRSLIIERTTIHAAHGSLMGSTTSKKSTVFRRFVHAPRMISPSLASPIKYPTVTEPCTSSANSLRGKSSSVSLHLEAAPPYEVHGLYILLEDGNS